MERTPEEALKKILAEPQWFGVAMQYLHNPDDAEEAIQEAMIRCMRSMDPDLSSYHLIQIRGFWSQSLRWTCSNFLRSRKEDLSLENWYTEMNRSHQPGPEELALIRADLDEAVELHGEMKEEYQLALTLSLDGLSYIEICEEMGVTMPIVKALLHRARKKMQTLRDLRALPT